MTALSTGNDERVSFSMLDKNTLGLYASLPLRCGLFDEPISRQNHGFTCLPLVFFIF